MDELLKRFRRKAKASENQRCPEPLKQLGCEYARERIKRGETTGGIAGQLAVAEQTLPSWLEKPSSDFLRVQVSESEGMEQTESEAIDLPPSSQIPADGSVIGKCLEKPSFSTLLALAIVKSKSRCQSNEEGYFRT